MKEKKLVPVVKQKPEEPIAPEIIAKALIDMSEGIKKALSAGLKREAIVVLIQARTKISQRDIYLVMENLEHLRSFWCTR